MDIYQTQVILRCAAEHSDEIGARELYQRLLWVRVLKPDAIRGIRETPVTHLAVEHSDEIGAREERF